MTATKPKQVRLNISRDSEEVIANISRDVPSLSETAIASIVIDAGMKAIREAGGRIHLPLYLEVSRPERDTMILNESAPKVRK